MWRAELAASIALIAIAFATTLATLMAIEAIFQGFDPEHLPLLPVPDAWSLIGAIVIVATSLIRAGRGKRLLSRSLAICVLSIFAMIVACAIFDDREQQAACAPDEFGVSLMRNWTVEVRGAESLFFYATSWQPPLALVGAFCGWIWVRIRAAESEARSRTYRSSVGSTERRGTRETAGARLDPAKRASD